MNTAFKTLMTTLLLASASTAMAASSVDLSVRGLITPSACTPALSNGGLYDVGKVSAKDLNADQETWLAPQTLDLTVTCDADTLMALEAKDNREGSDYQNDTLYFGLGLINDDEKLGKMLVRLLSPLANGDPAQTISSYDGGATWARGLSFERGILMSVAAAGVTPYTPVPLTVLNAGLYVAPAIAPANSLTLTNEVAIDGSVTLTVKYL